MRAVVLAGGLVAGLVVAHAFELYVPALNTPHTAVEGVAHPPSSVPTTTGLCRTLTVVVVDGLSFAAARALPELASLRRAGVLRPLRASFPTYTSPAITAMVTGLGPRDSGIRINDDLDRGVVGLDRVSTAAGDLGVPVTLWIRGWEPFATLVGPPRDAALHLGRAGFLAHVAAARVPGGPEPLAFDGHSPARALTFVYIGEVDEAAHRHGVGSPEYREAATIAANLVGRFAATLDPDQDTMLVLSDHGHRPQGGHGGLEPEVQEAFLLATGGMVRRGVELGERPMSDVASTIAVLGGLRTPSSNLGLPMLDLLGLGDPETSLLLAHPFDEAARFLCRLAPAEPRCGEVNALVTRLRQPDPAAWMDAEELYQALGAGRDRGLVLERESGARQRLAIAAALIALGAAAAWVVGRRRALAPEPLARRLAAWLAPLVHVGVFVGAVLALGHRPTFSGMKPRGQLAVDEILACGVALVALAVFARIARPGRQAPWTVLAATALPFALLAAWVGWDPRTPPPPLAGILVLELGPGVIGAAVSAIFLAWLLRSPPGGPEAI